MGGCDGEDWLGVETLKATSVRTGAFLAKSNSMVEDTREDSEPTSLGAGEEQVLVFVEPKPESQNISFSRISLGKLSNPSPEFSRLDEDCVTVRADELLKEELLSESEEDCCTLEEVLLLLGCGPSANAYPSFLGALIVSMPSLERAVATWSISAAGGRANSL